MGLKSSTDNSAVTSLQRFRKAYRRIDYYPSDAAMAAIISMKSMRHKDSIRVTLDALVLAGYQCLSKNLGPFPESNKA